MITHSVVIPTFNRPRLLRRAVSSAIVAAGTTGEVIVVDDCSDVPAEEVLSDMVFERLRVLRNLAPLASGGSPSRNRGADVALGEVLFFLDDDDELLERYCATVLSENVQARAAFGFCARQFATTGGDGALSLRTEKRALPNGPILPGVDFREKTFPFSAGFWMTKETFNAVGPMETDMRTNSDTEYTCRLYASDITGWYTDVPGVRVHEVAGHLADEMRSVTKRTRSCDRAKAFRLIAHNHADFLSNNPSAAVFIFSRLMRHLLRAGYKRDAAAAAFSCSQALIRLKISTRFAK